MKKPSAPNSNRDQIVDAALSVFIDQGLQRTSVRDIARKAGVSLGNLYNHFSGKDALIAEIARLDSALIEERLSALDQNAPAPRRLETLLLLLMKDASAPQTAILTIDLTAEAIRNPGVARAFEENEARVIAVLNTLLADDDPACAMAKVLFDTATALGTRIALDPAFSPEMGKDALHRLLRAVAIGDAAQR